jgi:hypothetical protein
MSRPTCANWHEFVSNLECQSNIDNTALHERGLIQRAFSALQVLRRQGQDISSAISKAVYSIDDGSIPSQAEALASVFWPLVCTTNYDDIYFRAKLKRSGFLPRILGRSEADCREVLRHIGFPSGEAVWVLQGLLSAKDLGVRAAMGSNFNQRQLELELVVGHAEYRKVAHLAPHFRRCFAELFRTRSLVFLGSGLAEPYFLTLFDEIIELTGPPLRPHFAVIEEGDLDPEFLQRQYHVICNTYPKGEHGYVTELLRDFARFTNRGRVRPSSWGFRVGSPQRVGKAHAIDHFKVVCAGLPNPRTLPEGEVVAISCGRGTTNAMLHEATSRGSPLVSDTGAAMMKLAEFSYDWLDDWTVKWKSLDRAYGVVAREQTSYSVAPRDRRSPDAIRMAFLSFLRLMDKQRIRLAHIQLLGAGKLRVFQPWVSLVQMARAYGQWARESNRPDDFLRVNVYVVDPGVIAMLQGGYIDLVEPLEDSRLHIDVEVIDASGSVSRYHHIVSAEKELGDLIGPLREGERARVHAHPTPTREVRPRMLQDEISRSLREFGLVSGSTLVIDYRGLA